MPNELIKARQTIESLSRQLEEALADRDKWMLKSQLHYEGKERFCIEANRRIGEVIQERDALAELVERIGGVNRIQPDEGVVLDIMAILAEYHQQAEGES